MSKRDDVIERAKQQESLWQKVEDSTCPHGKKVEVQEQSGTGKRRRIIQHYCEECARESRERAGREPRFAIEYKRVGGAHFFTSEDLPGLCAANADLQLAAKSLAYQIEDIIKGLGLA